MKITFLGTSHGMPAADRHCSAALIETGGCCYLIDAGAPVADLLVRRGVDMRTLKGVFTTHLHGDHAFGVIQLASLCSWAFRKTDLDIFLTEERGVELVKELICAFDGPIAERVRLKLMTDDTVWQDEHIRITPMPTQHLAHLNRPAYSYLVEADGKRVLFSGDLSQWIAKDDFPAYALENEVDLLICEFAHFHMEHIAPYLEKCKAKELIFNHVFPIAKLDEIAELDGKYAYPIRAVADGEEIEL